MVFVTFLFLIPDSTTPAKYDRRCWINWSNYIFGNGLGNIYSLEVNYLPLYHYILWVYSTVAGSTEAIIKNINALKYITLFFELVGVYFVIKLVAEKYMQLKSVLFLSLFIILNPAFFYDNVLYGQIDGLYATFLFISVYYGIKEKPLISSLAFVIAVNLKLQGIIFAPLVYLLNIQVIAKQFSIRYFVSVLLAITVLQLLILLPFFHSNDVDSVMQVIKNSQGHYPWVSMGAMNLWYYFYEDPHQVNDYIGVMGWSLRALGMVAFFIGVLLSLTPFFKWRGMTNLKRSMFQTPTIEKILLIGVLLPLLFFYLNTEMHARYVHAAIIFAAAYALFTKKFLLYFLVSLAYFLNLESTSKLLKGDLEEYSQVFFNPVFVATLFFVVIGLCFVNLFRSTKL